MYVCVCACPTVASIQNPRITRLNLIRLSSNKTEQKRERARPTLARGPGRIKRSFGECQTGPVGVRQCVTRITLQFKSNLEDVTMSADWTKSEKNRSVINDVA